VVNIHRHDSLLIPNHRRQITDDLQVVGGRRSPPTGNERARGCARLRGVASSPL